MADKIQCLMNGCKYFISEKRCARCGFYPPEAERRKTLPLIQNRAGLLQKHVGKIELPDEVNADER